MQFCLKRMVQTMFCKRFSDKYGDRRLKKLKIVEFFPVFDIMQNISEIRDPVSVIFGSVSSPTLTDKLRSQTTAPYALTCVTRHELSQKSQNKVPQG